MDLPAILGIGLIVIGLVWLVSWRLARPIPRDPYRDAFGDVLNLAEGARTSLKLKGRRGDRVDPPARVRTQDAIARRHGKAN